MLTSILWGLQTAASIAAIVMGIEVAAVGTATTSEIAGFSALAVLGGIGLIVSLVFGNTGPTLIALFKYPLLFIWWTSVLIGSTIAIVYGVLEFKNDEKARNLIATKPQIGPILTTASISVAFLLALTLVFRSSYNLSKFILFR